MAATMSTAGLFSPGKNPFLGPIPLSSSFVMLDKLNIKLQQRSCMRFVVEGGKSGPRADNQTILEVLMFEEDTRERFTCVVAAVMSSLGIIFMSVLAVYYRFSYQMEEGGELPYLEIFSTFVLSLGAAVSMELMSRWVHKTLWHASLWHMHESHHKPREGLFELNDAFAVMNAVPAIVLLAYGVFHKGLLPGICFGSGLGFTVLGITYIFVHNGIVHKRFPVGPIANVPYFRKVAAAHRLHHMEKFKGVPYGLFLGPKEVEDVGGHEALEIEINTSIKSSASRAKDDWM
ncbi:hypothetical protein AgCh_013471 [Apium graveolens]